MTRSLSQDVRDAKNAKFNTPIFLYQIDAGVLGMLYYVDNIESVTWNGHLYSKFPIKHRTIKQKTSNEIGEVHLRISNINFAIIQVVRETDLKGRRVIIRQVYAEALNDPVPVIDESWYIKSFSIDGDSAISFTLRSALDVMQYRLPGRVISKELFPYIPKGRHFIR